MIEGCTPVPCEFPCVDKWRIDQVRETALRAYLELQRVGDIKIQYPVRVKERSAIIEIRYLAAFPHGWTLEELKKAEKRMAG